MVKKVNKGEIKFAEILTELKKMIKNPEFIKEENKKI